jgi:hypothetical protein
MLRAGALPVMFSLLIGLVSITSGRANDDDRHYNPAACGESRVTIFPPRAKPVAISLPTGLRCSEFSGDGHALLGSERSGRGPYDSGQTILQELAFDPTQLTRIRGSERLNEFVVTSLAATASKDKLLISAKRRDGDVCGIFEIGVPAGRVRPIITKSDCQRQISELELWREISISPDARQAAATRGSASHRDLHVELIDLVAGTTTRLVDGFSSPSWSPDGKWIAALKGAPNRAYIYLIDPTSHIKPRRLSGRTNLKPAWSPDSRFILLVTHDASCGIRIDVDPPETLMALDVKLDRISTVHGSRCLINDGVIGWVDDTSATEGGDQHFRDNTDVQRK